MNHRALLATLTLVLACSHGPRPTYSTTFTDRAIRIGTYAASFHNAEPTILHELEGETRILDRIVPKPMSVREGDTAPMGSGLWISRGFVDPFMFTDRESALEQAQSTFMRIAFPTESALGRELERALTHAWDKSSAEDALLAHVALEEHSLRRLLEAEGARLERERTLPKGAADLVRTFSLTWPLVPAPGALHDVESIVTWRLVNLRDALQPGSLSEAERLDLRAALGELAPRLTKLPKARAALEKLTTSLDAMWSTPFPVEGEAAMDKMLHLDVGSPLRFDALDGAFERSAQTFELSVAAGFSVLDAAAQSRVRARAKQVLLGAEPCTANAPIRTVLDMAPPPERAWACSLVRAYDLADKDETEIALDLAWHDAVVVARWAVSTHGPLRAPDAARRRATLLLDLTDAESNRLMILAQAHPMNAIAAGVASIILLAEGAGRARARARIWRGLGDAPMDLVAPFLPLPHHAPAHGG